MTQKVAEDKQILVQKVIEGLQEKKGQNLVVMDLTELSGAVTDYFVIATATSDRHAQALGESVRDLVRRDLKDRPINVEGMSKGEWVLMDYVNVVVHIFLNDKREFYNIEDLWGDAKTERIGE